MNVEEAVKERLARLITLNSPEPIARRVLALGENPDPTPDEILSLADDDPAIASLLLRVANSPLHAQRRICTSARQALRELTERAALSIILESIDPINRQTVRLQGLGERIWLHSQLCAAASRSVGRALGHERPDELFLAGLLQNIGILALLKAERERYVPLLARSETFESLIGNEQTELGVTHLEVGIWLAREWRLPPFIISSMKSHDNGKPADDVGQANRGRLASVALGRVIADWCVELAGKQDMQDKALSGAFTHINTLLRRVQVLANRFGVDLSTVMSCLPEITAQTEKLQNEALGQAWSAQQRRTFHQQRRFILRLRHFHKQRTLERMSAQSTYLQARNQMLEETVKHDAMTGLYNRAYFGEVLERESRLVKKHGATFSLALIDLDGFKAINDNYGHPLGDRFLKEVAKVLQTHTRDTDVLARFGGDEFVLLLPGTDAGDASQLCDRLLKAVECCLLKHHSGRQLATSASIGLVTPAHIDVATTPDNLLMAADAALYAAKRRGGGCVEIYQGASMEACI